jgi:hypothetical protein
LRKNKEPAQPEIPRQDSRLKIGGKVAEKVEHRTLKFEIKLVGMGRGNIANVG